MRYIFLITDHAVLDADDSFVNYVGIYSNLKKAYQVLADHPSRSPIFSYGAVAASVKKQNSYTHYYDEFNCLLVEKFLIQ